VRWAQRSIEIPTIEIKPPSSYKALECGVGKHCQIRLADSYQRERVEALFARLKKVAHCARQAGTSSSAAIGPATQQENRKQGLKVVVTPDRYVAEAVAEALKGKTEGKRVLLVRAKVARDVLPIELRKSGAKVDVAEAYETHVAQGCERKAQPAFFAMIHRARTS